MRKKVLLLMSSQGNSDYKLVKCELDIMCNCTIGTIYIRQWG